MIRLSLSAKIIGAYFTDDATISSSGLSQPHWFENRPERGFNYMPVLNCIKLNTSEEFKFCTDGNADGLTAYNLHNRGMALAAETVKNKKIDVTSNDLFCGDIDMVLNFTDSIVNVVSDNYHSKDYVPLDRTKFSEYEGGVMVLSLFTLNAPKKMYERYGFANYFSTLAKSYAGKIGCKNLDMYNTYNFLVKCLMLPGVSQVALADTVKVAKAYWIPPNEMMRLSKSETLYFLNKRMLISRDNPLSCRAHPDMSNDIRDDSGVIETIRANGVACFMVDNDDAVGDRYYNFAGAVHKVPKIKDREKTDGLYITPIDASKRVIADNITPLDKIDEGGFVFRSVEEANVGADVRVKYKDDVEINKLTLHNESIELKRENDEKERTAASLVAQLRLDSEAAMSAMRLENERNVANMKLENERIRDADRLAHEREMSELRRGDAKAKRDVDDERARIKTELEYRKQETDNSRFYYDMRKTSSDTSILGYKQQYEEGRYSRDSTVETIKTVGAITGLVLGGMMLYNKHNS